ELYERVGTLITHVSRMGSSLDRSVEDYNRFVSSLESRFLVTARKFPSTGIVAEELDAAAALDARSRGVSAEELTHPRSVSFNDRGPTDLRGRHTGSNGEPDEASDDVVAAVGAVGTVRCLLSGRLEVFAQLLRQREHEVFLGG